ncbi:MAG: cupin domain-containing protein [Pseudomonadota bacterium]
MTDENDKVLSDDLVNEFLTATVAVSPAEAATERIKSRLLSRVREDVTSPAEALLTVEGAAGEWIENGPGNFIKILRSDNETMSMLVRLGPGATFPQHFHPADEETFVLEGETWFGDIHLTEGDYHLAPKGTTHGEVRTENGCMLLIRKASE